MLFKHGSQSCRGPRDVRFHARGYVLSPCRWYRQLGKQMRKEGKGVGGMLADLSLAQNSFIVSLP